jgi:hypothetical protein
MKNRIKEWKYVKLDFKSLHLILLINVSFVNNKDFLSQIEFVICLANATNKTNVIYWSSIKCKWVNRFILIAKLYVMTHEFDIDVILKVIISNMLSITVFLVFCIDFKSLYDCFINLSTTREKRLMRKIISLRWLYERREIIEVKWIHEHNNSIDSMIKTKSSSALKTIIEINRINLNIIQWVERKTTDATENAS